MGGWCRLTEDFRRSDGGGRPEICEGWLSLAANDVSRWRPPTAEPGAPPESLRARTFWYWVCARKGCTVRERPWGAAITKREHGELLRGDQIHEGWLRLEEDFVHASSG
eukprot:132187-Prymnesium_polylepis.1